VSEPRSPLAALRAAPWRFGFDAAVRILAGARDPAEGLRFRTPASLAFPSADVTDLAETKGAPPPVTVSVMGLTGPSGVLPRHYSETVMQSVRARARGLHDFLDLLGHRFVAAFARAGVKYRPARAIEIAPAASAEGGTPADPVSQTLLSVVGYGTPHLAPRLLAGPAPLLHYAGLFAMRPRSAERLAALLSDWLGMRVEVVEFVGAWLTLPPDQRTRMPAGLLSGAFHRLGIDAAAGVRAWDPQARFVLRIGPLGRAGFEALLPDRRALARLVSLVRAYVGFELGFAINPVLAAREVPPLRLDAAADPPPRLGWNTWVPGPPGALPRQSDAADALFEAEVIEAAYSP
jgi:type VI secretion system protein ImpH